MDNNERIKLIAQMAATIYAGVLSDPSCGFDSKYRNNAIEEAFKTLNTIESLVNG